MAWMTDDEFYSYKAEVDEFKDIVKRLIESAQIVDTDRYDTDQGVVTFHQIFLRADLWDDLSGELGVKAERV